MTSAVALREDALDALLQAKALVRADDTVAEADIAAFDRHMAEFRRLDDLAAAAAGREPAPRSRGGAIAGALEHYMGGSGTRPSGASTGQPMDGMRFSQTGAGGRSLGQAFIDARRAQLGPQAALVAPGSTAVATTLRPLPIADPRRARFVFNLFGEEDAPTGLFGYLRQTVRDLNAAVVAAGGVKPTSVMTLERINDSTKVIAHITEPINRFDLADAPSLRAFIDAELQLGLDLALDARVVAAILDDATLGTGVADLAGIRSAITALEIRELEPTAIVLSPTKWEAVEAEAIETFAANSNAPAATDAMARRLYGVPVVVTNSVDDDVAIVGDFRDDSGSIHATGPTEIDISDATVRDVDGDQVTDFSRNLVVFRAEFRREVAISRPTAFVAVSDGS